MAEKTVTLSVPAAAKKDFASLIEIAEQNNISVSKLIVACVRACVGTLEKEVPRKRTFMLDKTKVTI